MEYEVCKLCEYKNCSRKAYPCDSCLFNKNVEIKEIRDIKRVKDRYKESFCRGED